MNYVRLKEKEKGKRKEGKNNQDLHTEGEKLQAYIERGQGSIIKLQLISFFNQLQFKNLN